jgi:hypothetical protein
MIRAARHPPRAGPCDPQNPHGYFGRDVPVVKAVKNCMLGREFARDIKYQVSAPRPTLTPTGMSS